MTELISNRRGIIVGMRARGLNAVLAPFCRILLMAFLAHLLLCTSAHAFDLTTNRVLPTSDPRDLWLFLPIGYLISIAIETPVLLIGLSKHITFRQRLFAGVWLTACTYPIVVLVMPLFFASSSRGLYLIVAETFAPVAECALFWLAFQRHLDLSRATRLRNFGIIVLANLLSFMAGEILNATRWFGLF